MITDDIKKPIRYTILDQLCALLEPWVSDSEHLEEINEDTNLLTDLGMDSVGILQLILRVEKQFDIKIEDAELDSVVFSQMSNFVNIIEAKTNEAD